MFISLVWAGMLLVTSGAALAASDELERPRYSVEFTATNGVMAALCDERQNGIYAAVAARIRNMPDDSRTLDDYDRYFPDQMRLFDQFVNSFFSDQRRPRVVAHKDAHPSYLKVFPDGFSMRAQFEIQAIEMQTSPLSLKKYVLQIPRVDREFFARARILDLKPHRLWGMGHEHEGLEFGYPASRPEVQRNRFVGELEDEYFWQLISPDIEASIHWDKYPKRMRDFMTFLEFYDGWLTNWTRRTPYPSLNRMHVESMRRQIVDNPLFGPRDSIGRVELNKLIDDLAKARDPIPGDGILPKLVGLFRDLQYPAFMRKSLQFAFHGASRGSGAVAVALKHLNTEAPTLEHRRIPAHRDADEAAMWMHLLEGRWRRARDYAGLMPLTWQTPPRTDAERVALFIRYITSANCNPLDFARFLPLYLRWRVLLRKFDQPRWAQVRHAIECELKLKPELAAP